MTTEPAARHVFHALVVVLGLLSVTGAYLAVEYRPEHAGVDFDAVTAEVKRAHYVRTAHRLLAVPATGLAVLLVGFGLARRRFRPLGVLLLVVAVSVSGYALPWSQVALRRVVVGTDFEGVLRAAFDDLVRFVIVGGAEVSQGRYRAAVLVHLVVLPVLLGVFLFRAVRVGGGADRIPAARRSNGGRRQHVGTGPPEG
ncbi:MAG TPA: hypothetical protein VHF47_08460 [Acidimicrobiales bacterium]|nr:hypothetical protein [Acidimicrobiales bacterium]